MPMNIFVNLSVKDLPKTKEFFAGLGFKFNAQFTDDNAACMIVNDTAYYMLLTEPFFKGFIQKEIADTSKVAEAINAVSVDSREEVDQFADKALSLGAAKSSDAQDHGFMYSRSFQDLDGHLWEVFWMDPNQVQG